MYTKSSMVIEFSLTTFNQNMLSKKALRAHRELTQTM